MGRRDPANQSAPFLVFRYQAGSLLVGAAVGDPDRSPQFSSNHYLVDFQRDSPHAAKPSGWDSSLPVGIHVDSPFRRPPAKEDEEVLYAGRTLRGRGRRLDSFVLSPDGQWLAIMSWQRNIPGCSELGCIDLSIALSLSAARIDRLRIGNAASATAAIEITTSIPRTHAAADIEKPTPVAAVSQTARHSGHFGNNTSMAPGRIEENESRRARRREAGSPVQHPFVIAGVIRRLPHACRTLPRKHQRTCRGAGPMPSAMPARLRRVPWA